MQSIWRHTEHVSQLTACQGVRHKSMISLRPMLFCHVLVMAVSSTSQARLGETERQSIVRYGSAQQPKKHAVAQKEILPGRLQTTHHYQGWVITLVYVGGNVVIQEYAKQLPHASGAQVQPDELKAILGAEANGATWKASLASPFNTPVNQTVAGALLGEKHWTKADGSHATLTTMQRSVIFYSKEGVESMLRAIADKEEMRKRQIPKF